MPDIARAHDLTDWQLGPAAAAFGFARMAGAIPAGALAGRRLAASLMAAAPALLGVGVLALATAAGHSRPWSRRLAIGLAHTLGMVGGLTAVLRDHRSGSAPRSA